MSASSPARSAGHCAQCGASLRENASFCIACGAPVAPRAAPAGQPAQAQGAQRSKLWLAVGVAVLLLAVAAVGLALINSSQKPASTAAVTVPTAPGVAQDIPYPDIARVSPEQAHISAMSGDALIVDVRGQEFYEQGHARSALSIPLEELPARLAELPKDKAILLYCT